MPRSSGQNAMPSRAIRFDGSWMIWLPSNRTLPARRGTMPMIAFSVVVLPAPLRPSSVTSSPRRTSIFMPCRTWDSPYQAWRSWVVSAAAVAGAAVVTGSIMCRPHVGLHDLGILRDRRVVALGEDLAARQHRDRVAQIGHHAEVVLDHDDRPVGGDLADQLADPADVLVAHARHRLVEQHGLGVERQ